jgi:hypothetical protein
MQCCNKPWKSNLASRGADDDTASFTILGYFCLNQAAKFPGYEPPKATTGEFWKI